MPEVLLTGSRGILRKPNLCSKVFQQTFNSLVENALAIFVLLLITAVLDVYIYFLLDVKVTYIPGKGKILAGPITDILPTAVGQTYFTLNGTKTSVHQYFKSEYDKEVNPNGICLQLRGRSQVPAEVGKS